MTIDENSVEARLYPVVSELAMLSAVVASLLDWAAMPETPVRIIP
jgi:hypothetical protein